MKSSCYIKIFCTTGYKGYMGQGAPWSGTGYRVKTLWGLKGRKGAAEIWEFENRKLKKVNVKTGKRNEQQKKLTPADL